MYTRVCGEHLPWTNRCLTLDCTCEFYQACSVTSAIKVVLSRRNHQVFFRHFLKMKSIWYMQVMEDVQFLKFWIVVFCPLWNLERYSKKTIRMRHRGLERCWEFFPENSVATELCVRFAVLAQSWQDNRKNHNHPPFGGIWVCSKVLMDTVLLWSLHRFPPPKKLHQLWCVLCVFLSSWWWQKKPGKNKKQLYAMHYFVLPYI